MQAARAAERSWPARPEAWEEGAPGGGGPRARLDHSGWRLQGGLGSARASPGSAGGPRGLVQTSARTCGGAFQQRANRKTAGTSAAD